LCVAPGSWQCPEPRAEVSLDCSAGDLSVTSALNLEPRGRGKDFDKLAKPLLARRQWDWECYEVQYIRGDDGRPDTIFVSVKGVRDGRPPSWGTRLDQGGRGAMPESELLEIAKELKASLTSAPGPYAPRCFAKCGSRPMVNARLTASSATPAAVAPGSRRTTVPPRHA
jgi:hypothetical protein